MNTRGLSALLIAPLLLGACTSIQPKKGFGDVERLVKERTGHSVRWNQGSNADVQVDADLDRLLSTELTENGAIQVALLNNQDLQAVYEGLGVAQADLVEAGLLRNPVFSGEARFQEGGGPVELELGLSQNFLGIFFVPLRRRVAEAGFEVAKLRVSSAVIQLVGNVRAAFYEVQASEQLLELRRSVAAATEASAELATRLHEAGNIRDLDLSSERALYAEALVDVTDAELSLAESRERLNTLMGVWGKRTAWSLAPRLPDPEEAPLELSGLESRAIEKSLELSETRFEMESEARRLGFTRSDSLTEDNSLGVTGERDGEGDWSVGPSIELPVPLFSQGQSSIFRLTSRLRATQQAYAAAAVRIRSDVRASASRLLALRAKVAHYKGVLIPLRHDVVTASQRQYNAMQIGAFQLLQAKQDEIDAGRQYVETLRDYWLTRVRLDQLLIGARGGEQLPESSVSSSRVGSQEHGDALRRNEQ